MHALLQVICVKLYVLYNYYSLVYVCYNIINKNSHLSQTLGLLLLILFIWQQLLILLILC